MSLLINLSALMQQPTGISTYSYNVIKNLKNLEFELVAPFEIPPFQTHLSPNGLSAEYGIKGHIKRLIWLQRSLPKLCQMLQTRLLFSPLPEAPLGGQTPSVVMMHDLIPLRFGRKFSPISLYNRFYVPAVLQQARHILCNSTTTAKDLSHFFQIPAQKVTTIPLAYDAEQFRWLNLATRNYFLFIGRIPPYKNVERLLKAFAQMTSRGDYELWFVGPTDPRYTPPLQALAAQLNVSEQVKFLDYVAYTDLPIVINQAIALVYPSLWEGFGLPVLEAMACGTPVITSNQSALPEVAGDAALLVDPYQVEAISAAMQAVATDAQLREHLRQAGLTRAQQFSWAKTGAATAAVLERFM